MIYADGASPTKERERERVCERLRSISWLCLTRCQFPDAALVVATVRM